MPITIDSQKPKAKIRGITSSLPSANRRGRYQTTAAETTRIASVPRITVDRRRKTEAEMVFEPLGYRESATEDQRKLVERTKIVVDAFVAGDFRGCLEAVAEEHRYRLIAEIEATGRTVIPMTFAQLRRFGCNLLELQGKAGPVIAISATAVSSLKPDQIRALEGFGKVVEVDIPTIEAVGGGSVRCTIAEIHLPRR